MSPPAPKGLPAAPPLSPLRPAPGLTLAPHCHPERSEGSRLPSSPTLRRAQGNTIRSLILIPITAHLPTSTPYLFRFRHHPPPGQWPTNPTIHTPLKIPKTPILTTTTQHTTLAPNETCIYRNSLQPSTKQPETHPLNRMTRATPAQPFPAPSAGYSSTGG